MTEIATDLPTHFSRSSASLSSIDRAFVSLSPHFLLETETTLDLIQEAPELADWQLSDHAILSLTLKPRGQTPKGQQKIPPFIFKHPRYKQILANCMAGFEHESLPPPEAWSLLKEHMIVAATVTRRELMKDPDLGQHHTR
eukprot:9487365-Pyramimonas_sp.AAC.1